MSNPFTYSILQYKHSLVLGESLNVGIVFFFSNENIIHFEVGNLSRIKSIYQNVDLTGVNAAIKNIRNRINKKAPISLFDNPFERSSIIHRLNEVLIPEESSLQFAAPVLAVNTFYHIQKTIEDYSKIFLNLAEIKRDDQRHNETYIIKTYTGYMLDKFKGVENKITKDKEVKANGVHLNFEIAWKNDITHLVKPISFDLKQETDIQEKSVKYFGYFNLLNEYAKLNHYEFDILVTKPQDDGLFKHYKNALDILSKVNADKKIITEDEFRDYAEQTAYLLKRQAI